jgi:flagellar FliL protein
MADSKEAAPGKDGAGKPAEKPAGKKVNSKRLVVIGSAALALLGGGGAAAYFLLKPKPEAVASADDAGKAKGGAKEKTDKEKDKDKKGESKPLFVEFETFTSNTKDPEKFLQIKLTFQVKSEKAVEGLKDLTPVVRSAVIPVLGAQDPPTLMTNEGKEKLTADLVLASNKALAGTGLDDEIDTVLITHMIIQ